MTRANPMGIGSVDAGVERRPRMFIDALNKVSRPDVLEVGTLRSQPDRPTHHTAWLPDAVWTRADIAQDQDVDVIADAHDLAPFEDESFDGAVAIAVWEHLERPWLAAKAFARVLRPGGYVYVCTHQTFPLHGYPSDFFRFSDRALSLLFEDAGLEVVEAGYVYRAKIVPPKEVTVWDPNAPAWLCVDVLARKPDA